MANRYEKSFSYTAFYCTIFIEIDHRLSTWAKGCATFCCDLSFILEKGKSSAFYLEKIN